MGMSRHFLRPEAQARFNDARLEALRAAARVAVEESCEFIVVAGDAFESNQVATETLLRTLEALKTISMPVFILPGNHDAFDAGSIYRRPAFRDRKPSSLLILEDSTPREALPGVEVVGAPWRTRRPLEDLARRALSTLGPPAGLRLLVAHGAVDKLNPDPNDPALLRLGPAEEALRRGHVHYLALGDRHSTTEVGSSGKIWYSGAPEATDYGETDPGNVLVVELSGAGASVTPRRTGSWRFQREAWSVDGDLDLERLRARLDDEPQKDRRVLKLDLTGTLSLRQASALEELLEEARSLYAAIECEERHRDIAVLPDDEDFSSLNLSGFARAALDRLRSAASGPSGGPARAARDALQLLVRLCRRAT